jgi:FkbM family methyltransferase
MRAITPHWPAWMLRQLLLPVRGVAVVVTTRQGARYALSDPVDDAILRSVGETDRSLYFPDPDDSRLEGVILDVGAHHGFYAIEALRRYPRCRVIAVEPDPASCAQLARNLAANRLDSRVRIVNAGVGPAAGRGRLERDASGSWATRVTSAPGGDVEVLTLEAILAGDRPDIVKCNAEGAEFALVPQLVALGVRPSLLILMAHPRFGSAAALAVYLTRAGFDVRDADEPPRGQRFHCRTTFSRHPAG